MANTHVFAYGGSIVCPGFDEGKKEPIYDIDAIQNVGNIFRQHLNDGFMVIIGGGRLARHYQQSREPEFRRVLGIDQDVKIDELPALYRDGLNYLKNIAGIEATLRNAQEVINVLSETELNGSLCPEVLTDPYMPRPEGHRIYVGGSFRPGASTDFACMLWAQVLNANMVHKVSNYDVMRDVRASEYESELHNTYRLLLETSFQHVIGLVGNPGDFRPGDNTPLDPSAAALGLQLSRKIPGFQLNIGRSEELEKMIAGKKFRGTIIR